MNIILECKLLPSVIPRPHLPFGKVGLLNCLNIFVPTVECCCRCWYAIITMNFIIVVMNIIIGLKCIIKQKQKLTFALPQNIGNAKSHHYKSSCTTKFIKLP